MLRGCIPVSVHVRGHAGRRVTFDQSFACIDDGCVGGGNWECVAKADRSPADRGLSTNKVKQEEVCHDSYYSCRCGLLVAVIQ